jgi:ABC-type Zn uptake system ZnuABC Zn-binding protein ZnuA
MISQSIQAELEALLPEQAEYFAENTLTFQTNVEKIFTDFAAQNEQQEAREFIVFHDAYNYLLDSASIPVENKIIFSPNAIQEIGTAHMSDLIDEIEIH